MSPPETSGAASPAGVGLVDLGAGFEREPTNLPADSPHLSRRGEGDWIGHQPGGGDSNGNRSQRRTAAGDGESVVIGSRSYGFERRGDR
jgi:hypothetical protein